MKILFRLPSTEKEWRDLEVKRTAERNRRLFENPPPGFSFGLEYLAEVLNSKNLELNPQFIENFIQDWFRSPEEFLRLQGTSLVKEVDGFLQFPSILNQRQIARFRYCPQPVGTPGRKVALIHLMHWNGRLRFYESGINFIRSTLLPISTLIHIPAGRDLNPGENGALFDYDAIGPNVGLTVFKARQDIHDIQFIARYLREELDYEEIGLFSYSLGSLGAVLAAVANPELFDFCVFHLVADDFFEAVMDGVATTRIADQIRGKIDESLLRRLWSTISPGAYAEYFDKLPSAVRLVQAKHDYVFGPENVRRFNEKILRARPETELVEAELCHNSLDTFPWGWKIMLDDIAFIYRHSKMKECKRFYLFKFMM